jgi:deazaflavin-dependent oxidoreductase (nitroreductase family)
MSERNESVAVAEQGPLIPRWVLKLMTQINVVVYRASRGRLMNSLGGDPICLVTMTGAKSGRTRTIPLMFVPRDDAVLLVASQGGAPRNPVWYRNLVAHPNIVVEEGGQRRELRARELHGDERAAAWPVCVARYAPYADYQLRTAREIPVFACEAHR